MRVNRAATVTLKPNPSSIQWVSTIYMLALGVVIPLSGWLGDLLGFKRLYIVSMITFVVAYPPQVNSPTEPSEPFSAGLVITPTPSP